MRLKIAELANHRRAWTDTFLSSYATEAMNRMVVNALDSKEAQDMAKKLASVPLSSSDEMDPSFSETKVGFIPDIKSAPLDEGQLTSDKSHRLRPLRVCEQVHQASYSSFIGAFSYRSQVFRIQTGGGAYGEPEKRELETAWTIIPSKWLYKYCFSLLWSKSTEGWKHQFNWLPVIAKDSPIFRFTLEGNVTGVRNLLQSGLASANDCDDRGFTVLHVRSLHPILHFPLDSLISDPSKRAAALRHTELCLLLIDSGANANAVSFFTRE
jgi:hypothetical protein